MCMSVCLPGLTNDSMLPQNIHHLSDVITDFCGHGDGDGDSEMNIRELVPLLFFSSPFELNLNCFSKAESFCFLTAASHQDA